MIPFADTNKFRNVRSKSIVHGYSTFTRFSIGATLFSYAPVSKELIEIAETVCRF